MVIASARAGWREGARQAWKPLPGTGLVFDVVGFYKRKIGRRHDIQLSRTRDDGCGLGGDRQLPHAFQRAQASLGDLTTFVLHVLQEELLVR